MDEAGNHHSQQTITRTENQTPHVPTHKWELSNENTWTQGGEHHTRGPVAERGTRGRIALGEIPNVDDGLMGTANHQSMCILTGWPAPPYLWAFLVRWNERLEKRNETQRQSIEKEKVGPGDRRSAYRGPMPAPVSEFPQYLLIIIFTILKIREWQDNRIKEKEEIGSKTYEQKSL